MLVFNCALDKLLLFNESPWSPCHGWDKATLSPLLWGWAGSHAAAWPHPMVPRHPGSARRVSGGAHGDGPYPGRWWPCCPQPQRCEVRALPWALRLPSAEPPLCWGPWGPWGPGCHRTALGVRCAVASGLPTGLAPWAGSPGLGAGRGEGVTAGGGGG